MRFLLDLLSLLNLLNLLNYGLGEFLGVSAWGLFFCVVVGDGLSGGRAALGQACGQGDCMFVSGAVVSPGHTMCLWLLPCRAGAVKKA